VCYRWPHIRVAPRGCRRCCLHLRSVSRVLGHQLARGAIVRDVVTMTNTIKRSLLAAIKRRRDRAAARTGVSGVCTKTVRHHCCSDISIGLHEECVESLNFAHCCLLNPLQTMGSLRAARKIAWVVRHAFCAIWTPYWSFILLRFLRLDRCDCRCSGSTGKRRCPRSMQHIRKLGLQIREQRIDGLEVDSGLRSVIGGH
jgi:hypothetical protein